MAEADKKPKNASLEQFAYLDMPKELEGISSIGEEQRFLDKFIQRTKENPFVPIGLIVTVGALSAGLSTLGTGNVKKAQNMMRLRVAAQGFTVLAMLGGMYYHSFKED